MMKMFKLICISSLPILFIYRTNINRYKQSKLITKEEYILKEDNKRKREDECYEINRKELSIIKRSTNRIRSNDIDFNENIYHKVKDKLIICHYLENLDIILLNLFNINKIKYNIVKRLYEYNGYCMGMCVQFIKHILKAKNIDTLEFNNGPNDEAKAYQLLYNSFNMSTGFNNNIDLKVTKPEYKTSEEIIDGIHLILIRESHLKGHAMVLIKSKDKLTLFDPNIGIIDLNNITIDEFIYLGYKNYNNIYYLYRIELLD
jgi:hypothetical protein